jgi:hypothetical protein
MMAEHEKLMSVIRRENIVMRLDNLPTWTILERSPSISLVPLAVYQVNITMNSPMSTSGIAKDLAVQLKFASPPILYVFSDDNGRIVTLGGGTKEMYTDIKKRNTRL